MKGGATELPLQSLLKLDVDQFYGIEFHEFPARIAETAMWMMDHIMNTQASLEFGASFLRIPLRKSPNIIHADALEIDWASIVPQDLTYIIGNPPFIGAKFQSKTQRDQVQKIAALGKSVGTLDYVCAWFIKAAAFGAPTAFVATNSITQGEQVAQLWQILFDRHSFEIAFGHRTFAWGSEARGKAAVHVVVLGIEPSANVRQDRRLFSYPDVNGDPVETRHSVISPYLIDASKLANPHLVVRKSSRPLSPRSKLEFGNMPNDDGNLILTTDEADRLKLDHPEATPYVRQLIGANSSMSGTNQFCLWLETAPVEILKIPFIKERLSANRLYRSQSKRLATNRLAAFPALFGEIRQRHHGFVLVPRHGAEGREYFPISIYSGNEIAHDSCQFISGGDLSDFSILSSKMHFSWLNTFRGRIKNDPRYSIGLVYNTFPMPGGIDLNKLAPYAQAILDARAQNPKVSLADLYDPNTMPSNLRRAHQANDRAVDRLYRKASFKSERERVEYLLNVYEKMVGPFI